ncbi:MAG: type II toxin-antitoxin system ParD family antitoxin [Aequorivita sp.]|nr:type II toxin-antitoxin system ParD family antitoxin [Aequorivita sp.]
MFLVNCIYIIIACNFSNEIYKFGFFYQFVSCQVSSGCYKNVSKVIRTGLRLLENEESKVIALKNVIQEGIDSGNAYDLTRKRILRN